MPSSERLILLVFPGGDTRYYSKDGGTTTNREEAYRVTLGDEETLDAVYLAAGRLGARVVFGEVTMEAGSDVA